MATVVLTFMLLIGWYAVRTLLVIGGFTWFQGRTWRRIIARAHVPAQVRRALRQAAGVLVFDAAVIVLVGQLGWIRFAPSTVWTTLLTFAVSFVWYEVWFYGVHRLLHETPLYRIHAIHHEAAVPHPVTTLSFSVAERAMILAGLIGFNALVSRVLPVAIAGLTLYGLVNHVLGVLGHSNVEVYPRGWADRRIGRVWSTVTHHALHHERQRGHYGLFTCVLDNLLGSAFADYPRLQRLAAAGISVDDASAGALRDYAAALAGAGGERQRREQREPAGRGHEVLQADEGLALEPEAAAGARLHGRPTLQPAGHHPDLTIVMSCPHRPVALRSKDPRRSWPGPPPAASWMAPGAASDSSASHMMSR